MYVNSKHTYIALHAETRKYYSSIVVLSADTCSYSITQVNGLVLAEFLLVCGCYFVVSSSFCLKRT